MHEVDMSGLFKRTDLQPLTSERLTFVYLIKFHDPVANHRTVSLASPWLAGGLWGCPLSEQPPPLGFSVALDPDIPLPKGSWGCGAEYQVRFGVSGGVGGQM